MSENDLLEMSDQDWDSIMLEEMEEEEVDNFAETFVLPEEDAPKRESQF